MADLSLDILNSVSIASPCTAPWEEMAGDDKIRHCSRCGLNVHNFEAMTRDEVERVLRMKLDDPSVRVCARLYRRADGTILMQDCPRGLAAARARVRKSVARIAAALGLLTAAGAAAYAAKPSPWVPTRVRGAQPFAWIASKLVPGSRAQMPPGMQPRVAGDICIPRTPPPAPSTPPPQSTSN